MNNKLIEVDYGRVRRLHARAREDAAMARWQGRPDLALHGAEWPHPRSSAVATLGGALFGHFRLVAVLVLGGSGG